jgi:hypothetical protein
MSGRTKRYFKKYNWDQRWKFRNEELFYCPICGFIDIWDNCEGWLEKGQRNGKELANCGCSNDYVIPRIVGLVRESRSLKNKVVANLKHRLHSKGIRRGKNSLCSNLV